MLKIFSISKNDWGGCGYFLSDAINECTDHHCIAVRMEQSRLHFPHDLTELRGQQIKRLYDWADVVHIHDARFNLPKQIAKPVVITHHGTRFRRAPDVFIKHANMLGWLITVATPDLTRFGPPLLPDCRPDLSQYRNLGNEFTVVHAPTKRGVKGTERVIAACEKAAVKLDLIEDVPWKECMERKGGAHLLIDQFEDGYGCNAIEAWSMGIPVISDGTEDVIAAIYDKFKSIPFVRPYSTLEETIKNLRDDQEAWIRAASVGHQHYLDYHSYESVAKLASWVYEQAVEHFVAREPRKSQRMAMMPKQTRAEKLTLLRYCGGNSGTTKWFPSVKGVTYQFSAVNPERYVYQSDVDWFLDQKSKSGRALFVREDA
jgi:glycosyltransferase involved in cell wall biosynthesis